MSNDLIRLKNPYTFWNGFYIYTPNLTTFLQNVEDKRIYKGSKLVESVLEFEEGIRQYAEGFKKGYFDFNTKELDSFDVFKNEERLIKKVLDFTQFYSNNKGGFPFYNMDPDKSKELTSNKYNEPIINDLPISISECHNRQDKLLCSVRLGDDYLVTDTKDRLCEVCYRMKYEKPENWFKKGYQGGLMYKAWFLILSNFEMFDEYFEGLKNKKGEVENKKGSDDIFKPDLNGECLFAEMEILLNGSKNDYAYIFRILLEKGYIHKYLKYSEFQEWLFENRTIDHRNSKYHTLAELGETRHKYFKQAEENCNAKQSNTN